MEEPAGDEVLEFKWGKKRGIGGKKKDVQFYESFTFDGDEYCLYDCVLVTDPNEPDSDELFVGKIIKIWEHTNKRAKNPRQVKLLWFFKPSEMPPDVVEGVPDLLANELFLASGEGPGVASVNPLEAICGKCSVLCISKDERNPQPADEELKSTDFVFRRAFDVGSCKVLDTIDDKIAGVDVKLIFNRAGRKKEATPVQKIQVDVGGYPDSLKRNEADVNGNPDSLKRNEADVNGSPDTFKRNGLTACGSIRNTEDNSLKSSDCRKSSSGLEEGKVNGHSQLVTKVSTFAEERSNQDSRVQQNTARRNEHVSCEASGSRVNHCDGKAQEREVKKPFTKQKSMPAEERYYSTCEASGSRLNPSNSEKPQANDVKKALTKQKSMPAGERYSKESNGLDDRPQKKQKLDGSFTVPNGHNTNILQNISSDGKRDTPRDRLTGDEVPLENLSVVKKKRDLGVSVSEGKDAKTATEKGSSKKPSLDGKLLKRAEDKMLGDDYKRNYQVTEVSRKPDAVNSKWFRPLPWEEGMREAEKEERLVRLQNLDPTYTSAEVEDLVYSALNEQCTARMIERTAVAFSHIGEALVIFNSRQAAVRAIRRLNEGCLLLSNGRPLVAAFAKINPPGKPPSFCGHIKLQKTQMRRETRDTVSTSRGSQPNTLEFEMAMEWWLHRARADHALETVSKRQLEEKRSWRINFKPKLP